jgi:hypothetical protein
VRATDPVTREQPRIESSCVHTEVYDPARYDRIRALDSAAAAGGVEEGCASPSPFCISGLGSGDSAVYLDALPAEDFGSEQCFWEVRREVAWSCMMHKGGAVPRLVSLQGSIDKDTFEPGAYNDQPVYRHPVDEQPELRAWSPLVLRLKLQVEKVLGISPERAFNHCLIQLYRNGHDFIGEHADKSLDILRGSPIVNLSLGCSRVMILRTKPRDYEGIKLCQKVTLPHNSIMKLGWDTNVKFTHEIKQDKRMDSLKREDEVLFGGERISFTFRRIATFERRGLGLYGQGAVCKTPDQLIESIDANRVREASPQDDGEHGRLLAAFSEENRSAAFDWDMWYGGGFNVLYFKTLPSAAAGLAVGIAGRAHDPPADIN